ncbi:10224_t:CDS:2, partial [Racocetra persica]
DEISLVDDQDNENIANVEDYYNYWQTYLKVLIDSVPKKSIQEWFQDSIWNKVELASNKSFIKASSKSLKSSYSDVLQKTYPISKYFDNIQEDRVH